MRGDRKKEIRVLVVDDSRSMRRLIGSILEQEPGFVIVGEADNGQQAVELCEHLRPDLMILDVMLPGLDGLQVTEHVMAHCPTPILIVTSLTDGAGAFRACDALAAGVVKVMEKPSVLGDDGWLRELGETARMVAGVRVVRHLRGVRKSPLPPQFTLATHGKLRVVAIGASTGGTAAISTILKSLPPDFPLPILFTLHMAAFFSEVFAEWLDTVSPLPVKLAVDGEPLPKPGDAKVLVAPGDRHLMLENDRLRLVTEVTRVPRPRICPSVDVMFESVAVHAGESAIGCLLTGMGSDGAVGLKALREAGGVTIAQDEETSVIYGMPAVAAELGAASRILALDEIGPALIALSAQQALAS